MNVFYHFCNNNNIIYLQIKQFINLLGSYEALRVKCETKNTIFDKTKSVTISP